MCDKNNNSELENLALENTHILNDKEYISNLLKNLSFSDCKPFIPSIQYAKVVKVYDGDTIHIITPIHSVQNIVRFRVRLSGIDAPEIKSKNHWEQKAANIVKTLLQKKIGNKIISLKNVSYDKYGRILADVYLENENINKWLISINWVCYYNGKGKKKVSNVDWQKKVEEYNNIPQETQT